MRPRVKSTVESLLARGGPARIARSLSRRDAVLAFHNVLPDDTSSGGDDALHMPWSRFREYLDVLTEDYDVVPLSRLLDEPSDERSRVAITFDDAYRGALILALPELAQRGLSATVFVPPGLMGTQSFWWDAVSDPDGEPLRGPLRRQALEGCFGDGHQVLEWARSKGYDEHDVHGMARPASFPELDWAAALPGVTLGAHGWWHRNLASLAPEHLTGELTWPLVWLGQRYPQVVPILAYPYGLDSPSVRDAAARAGYRIAFRCDGGRMPRRGGDSFSLPRVSIPAGLSPDGLRLRLTGIVER